MNKVLSFIRNSKFIMDYKNKNSKKKTDVEIHKPPYYNHKNQESIFTKEKTMEFFNSKIDKKYHSFLKNYKSKSDKTDIFAELNKIYNHPVDIKNDRISERLSEKIENMMILMVEQKSINNNTTLHYREINENSKSTITLMSKFYATFNELLDINSDKITKINLVSLFLDTVNFDYKVNNSDYNKFREETKVAQQGCRIDKYYRNTMVGDLRKSVDSAPT